MAVGKDTILSYLDQIAKHLWKGQVHGRAAVMIGSGFSRSATCLNPVSPSPPLWSDLAKGLRSDLSPGLAVDGCENPLQLASRFEARFGRQALHSRIRELTGDLQYEPGELHIRLLNLPWADVFTTNYDTLLERTLKHLEPRRHYEVVQTLEGVAGSSQPRIVKLHGSFPDHIPLIITEDDYRRYPHDHAPFVNTVQQSIMENAFVLLGFSGDDPNFLRWSGWVRDNLGENAPRIYLCGVFDELDGSEAALLDQRKIAVVNLAALLDGSPPGLTHGAALGFLLDHLEKAKPRDFTEWPYGAQRLTLPRPGQSGPTLAEDLVLLQKERQDYPGWVVCPLQVRDRLWDRSLEPRVRRIARDGLLDGVPLDERLAFLHELTWRCERCLYPLFEPLITEVKKAADEFFLLRTEGEDGQSEQETFGPRQAAPDCVECVAALLMALLRHARVEMNQIEHERLLGRLNELPMPDAEFRVALHFERCLWAWYQLDFSELESLVADWPDEKVTPFWQTRRASLLLTLGQYDEAWPILKSTLGQIRARLHEQLEDIWLLSQEAWTMWILYCGELLSHNNSEGLQREYRGRWRELTAYMCDPLSELDGTAQATRVATKPRKSEKAGFDPGRRTVSYQMGGDGGASERYLRHVALLRLREEGGFQIRLCGYGNNKEYFPGLFLLLLDDSPKAALGFAVRFHSESLTDLLTRMRVAKMPRDEVQSLWEWLTRVCVATCKRLTPDAYSESRPQPWNEIASSAIELLSRLTVRLNGESLSRTLDLACQLYGHPVVRASHPRHDCVKHLFERTLFAMSPEQIAIHLPQLVELPLGDAEGSRISLIDTWPEVFDFIPSAFHRNGSGRQPSISIRVPFFIHQLRHGSSGSCGNRRRALSRLLVLLRMRLLTEQEQQEVAKGLWEGVGPEQHDIPEFWGRHYLPSLVLHFPERAVDESKQRLKAWLSAADIAKLAGHFDPRQRTYLPPFVSKVDICVDTWNSGTQPRWCQPKASRGTRSLEWTAEEAEGVVRQAVDLWRNQREELQYWVAKPVLFAPDTAALRMFFEGLSQLITKTMIPYLNRKTSNLLITIRDTLDEMIEDEVPAQRNVHMLLWLDPGTRDFVTDCLKHGLRSRDRLVNAYSIEGVRDWALMSWPTGSDEVVVPGELRRALLALTLTRNTPACDILWKVNSSIIHETRDFYSQEDKAMLCEALAAILNENAHRPGGEECASVPDIDILIPASRLASALSNDYKERSLQEPDVLREWRELALNISLPELRSFWDGE